MTLRTAIATSFAGLAGLAAARVETDCTLDSTECQPISVDQVISVAEAQITILLDEIITLVSANQKRIDPRMRYLRTRDPMLTQTLRASLDSFSNIADATQRLHVHPNTVRYRARRIE